MKALVFQAGARHAYAPATFLEAAGHLGRLYTDLAFPSTGAERVLRVLQSSSWRSAIDRRTISSFPAHKIVNSYSGLLLTQLLQFDFARRVLPRFRLGGPWRIRRADLTADVIYAQYFTGYHDYARMLKRGTRLVSDVFAMPSTHQIINQERLNYPEWGEVPIPRHETSFFDYVSKTMISKSDALFCPSQHVIDDIVSIDPSALAKCFLIPYASTLNAPREPDPVVGRILFAGSATLNKGIHYLKGAADLLAQSNPAIKLIVAGEISAQVQKQMQAPNIECVGHLSQDQMREQLAAADVFAFPTLAEGRAGVVLEALAAGVPVVTTRVSGANLRDGEAGFIVPPRDPDKLAHAIAAIVENRRLRAKMASAARYEANAYNVQDWSSLFLTTLRALCEL